jgi:hypothetical protein
MTHLDGDICRNDAIIFIDILLGERSVPAMTDCTVALPGCH